MIARSFCNELGESWIVRIDRKRLHGTLTDSESGRSVARIRGGRLPADLMLSPEEFNQLSEMWLQETGEILQQPPFMLAMELLGQLSDTSSI